MRITILERIMNKPIECIALISIITFSIPVYSVPLLNCTYGDLDGSTRICTKEDIQKALDQSRERDLKEREIARQLIEEAYAYVQHVNREVQRLNSNN